MALQFAVAVRNDWLDRLESQAGTSCALEIRSGSAPANCGTAGSGTIIATVNLPADWMAAASAGAKAKSGTWEDLSADNAGTAAHFRLYNSQATKDETTCIMQGTVGQGSGDLSLDNNVLTAGQKFTVTGFTLTAPGA